MKSIYVWTDAKSVRELAGKGIYPKELSKVLWDESNNYFGTHCVALYDEKEILKTIEDEGEFWWREINRSSVSLDSIEFNDKPYRPRIMRKIGLLEYLCDYCGVSTERNVAAVIGEMAHGEGLTPIQFFNSLKGLGYYKINEKIQRLPNPLPLLSKASTTS
jgi:hypothetical protein